jgi:predicted DNA-binding transcriptional regulator YafY
MLKGLLSQHPKGLTLYEMATRLAVTPRSMRRYLAEIHRHVEIEPVAPGAGRAKRWRIAPAELPRRVAIRRVQAYALLAARPLFALLRGSTLYEEIDLAGQHLLGIARRPGRGPNAGVHDARLEDRFVYLPFAPKDYSAQSESLDDLFQAVADLRPLTCRYPRAEDGKLERLQLHPYALVLYKDAVLVLGLDVGRDQIRTFQLDHVTDTSCVTGARFELPKDFRLEDYWQGQFGLGKPTTRSEVVIDFDPSVAEQVRTRRFHSSQQLVPSRHGGVRLRMAVGDLDEVASWVLGFGPLAKVVSPAGLARQVRERLHAAWLRYEPARPASAARKVPRRATNAGPA